MDLLIVALAGLLLGSLINLLVIRIPREQRLWGWPRCTKTGAPLRWWQLLPIVGWLLQRGRAANGQALHWIFPLIELSSMLLVVRVYLLWGVSIQFAYLVFVIAVLLLTGAIDWLHRYIYTFVILGAALICLLVAPLVGLLWWLGLAGAAAGGLLFALFYGAANLLFPSASVPFGLGDVYLAIFIGAALGLLAMIPALFYGMLAAGVVAAGILLARRVGLATPTYMAYGSYLCLGALLYLAVNGLR